MNTASLFKNNRLCKALTGLSVEELKNLLPSFEEALKRERKLRKPKRKRAAGAGQKGTLHKAEQKLVLIKNGQVLQNGFKTRNPDAGIYLFLKKRYWQHLFLTEHVII